ncbi:MAG TPA: ion transporter [Spirochaetota bacterium]|nr:ion transporter [Spirochaetota bacterium]HOS39206.1 ion transporter [Spirochaetota bacterium]HPI23905.1 ion transporter [Spirochaetota bacterium]HPU87958.1 ion transporter [Spirochaetota bacterium]
MGRSIRMRLHQIMEPAVEGDRASKVFDVGIMALIVVNVLAVILETVKSIESEFGEILYRFEVFSVAVFTVEYALRLWSCVEDDRFARPVLGRLRYMVSPIALIDLLAVLPFYLPLFLALDLRFIRVLRLFRIFRLFKIGRYSESMKRMGAVFRKKKEELGLAVFIVLILLVFTSCIMYYVEHEAQPEAFSSIPRAMWWGVATLTTVGYGDVYPMTAIGKVLGAVIALLGVGMVALPAGIIASGFAEEIHASREEAKLVCPHCGKTFDAAKDGDA